MKESHLLGAASIYDFGLAASSLSGHARSQLVQKCDGLALDYTTGTCIPFQLCGHSRNFYLPFLSKIPMTGTGLLKSFSEFIF